MYGAQLKVYRNNEVSTVQDPQKIVKLLFEGAIRELGQVKNNFNNPRKRGQHLGKAIAIIGELQAGVNLEAGGEAAAFLYGLYGAIIRELSKINGKEKEKDFKIIDRSISYLSELRKIWIKTVLNNQEINSLRQEKLKVATAG